METPAQSTLTFADYLRPVWRFKWFVLLAIVAATAATYVYTNRQPKTYSTSAQVYVGTSSADRLLSDTNLPSTSTRTLANQARLLNAPRVAQGVKQRLGLSTPASALSGAVGVSAGADSDFLTVSSAGEDPRFIARLVDAFIAVYLAQQRSDVRTAARSALSDAREQFRQLGSGVDSSGARDQLRDRISTLENDIASPPSPGQQLAPARVPTTPDSPNPKRNAIFAALLTLMAGIVGAYLVDRSDRRLRRLVDVESSLDLPVLASLPHVRRPLPKTAGDPRVVDELREPCRTLQVNLELLRAELGLRVVMVTSALPSEGKSTLVRNLAHIYRESGLRVAVVEVDLRRPTLAGLFGVAPSPGLAEALEHGSVPAAVAVGAVDDQPGNGNGSLQSGALDVVVAGEPPENPPALLTADRMRPLLARLAETHDIVLLDAPPVLAVGDALPLLGLTDGVLLIVRAGTATEAAVSRLERTFERVNDLRLLGMVANDVEDDFRPYYASTQKGVRKRRPSADHDAGTSVPAGNVT